jgi:hypothetical protein
MGYEIKREEEEEGEWWWPIFLWLMDGKGGWGRKFGVLGGGRRGCGGQGFKVGIFMSKMK